MSQRRPAQHCSSSDLLLAALLMSVKSEESFEYQKFCKGLTKLHDCLIEVVVVVELMVTVLVVVDVG